MFRHTQFIRFVLAATLLLISASSLAQDMEDPLAGTTVEALGSAVPSVAQDQALVFLRITMEPGASIPFHHHPGTVVVVVESGVFGTEFKEGEATIVRADQEETETITAGGQTELHPDDSLAYEGAVHTMVNAGDEPLVLLVSALLDPEQPGFIFENAQ